MKDKARTIINQLLYSKENSLAAKLQGAYTLPEGKKRVYHYHIRKTAGTSLNLAFFSEHGKEEAKKVHQKISEQRFNLRTINRNEVFVGWDKNLLAKGNYYYGFSHSPLHEVNIPDDTYKITILRDPVKRVISHYNMLFHYIKKGEVPAVVRNEQNWASPDFDHFIKNIPKTHLQRQLYMFSSSFDVEEAFENIMGLDFVMFTESFTDDLKVLTNLLGRKLETHREKNYQSKGALTASQIDHLKELMQIEYELLKRVKAHHPSING